MKKLIYSLSVSCLVLLAITPVKAEVSTGITSNTSTQISQTLQNGTSSNAATSIGNNITSTVQQASSTTVSNLAGASTLSQTSASVGNLNQPQLPSNPANVVQITGSTTANINTNPQVTNANINANTGVQVANIVTVTTCSQVNGSLGNTDGSMINSSCFNQAKPRKVPEPGMIMSLILLGAYLIFWRRKFFQPTAYQSINFE